MKQPTRTFSENKAAFLLLGAESAAGASFAARHLKQVLNLGPDLALTCLLACIVAVFLAGAAFLILRHASTKLAGRSSLSKPLIFSKLVLALTPTLLLFLDFIQEKFALRNISLVLLEMATAGCIYLSAVFRYKLSHLQQPPQKPRVQDEAGRPLPRRILLLVFSASFIIYSIILLSGLLPSLPFTGDEPHYLLVTQSLVRDGDINLYNNYHNQDYLEFYPGVVSWHAYPGRKGPTQLFSKHFPALPVMLIPAYWCAEWLGKIIPGPASKSPTPRNIHILMARQTMTFLAALLVTLFFLLVWETTGSMRVAFYAWLFFAFSPPILFYSQLLYSELPVALILLWILRLGIFKQDVSRISLLGMGLGIGALPWFGIKYLILAIAAIVSVIYANRKTFAAKQQKILFLLGPPLLSGALFSAFLLHAYGTLLPTVVYQGTLAANTKTVGSYFGFQAAKFFAAAASHFLDQRAGILLYSPLYILFIPGIAIFFRKYRAKGLAVLLAILPYWGFCALGNFRGGFAPPGRPLLPGMAVLAFFVAATLAWAKGRFAPAVFRILAILSILIIILTITQPQFLFHEGLSSDSWNRDTQSHLLAHFSNPGIDLTRWAPNLIYLPKFSWPILLAWLALIAGIVLAVLKKEKKPVPIRTAVGIGVHIFFVFIFAFFLSFQRFFNVRLDGQRALTVTGGTVYFQDGNAFAPELEGFWTKGNSRTELVLHTAARLPRLRLELSSLVPLKARLKIADKDVPVTIVAHGRNAVTVNFIRPRGAPWQGGFLYLLRIETTGGFIPARIESGNLDARFLGLFVACKFP